MREPGACVHPHLSVLEAGLPVFAFHHDPSAPADCGHRLLVASATRGLRAIFKPAGYEYAKAGVMLRACSTPALSRGGDHDTPEADRSSLMTGSPAGWPWLVESRQCWNPRREPHVHLYGSRSRRRTTRLAGRICRWRELGTNYGRNLPIHRPKMFHT